MTIRTPSQLPETSALQDNDLVLVSKYISADAGQINSLYQSKKITGKQLLREIEYSLSNNIGSSFGMYDSSKNPLNVHTISDRVTNLMQSNMTINGVKTFTSIPKINATLTDYSSADDSINIPNIQKTKDLISQHAGFVGPNYIVDNNVNLDNEPAYIEDSDSYMHWHFDDGTRDSSQWINPATLQKDSIQGVMCKYTGYLTMYGWLADSGAMLAQDAWVGLYGKLVTDSTSTDEEDYAWTLLQVKPWIKGTYASSLQYVSFNMPVRKGLYLKIKTGFAVNGNVGGFQDGRSITYALNQPNSFVGYISRVDED